MSGYRLEEAFIPIIDVQRSEISHDERQAVAREIDRACREIGFFLVTGYEVRPGLLAEVYETSRAFFALPPTLKDPCRPPSGSMLGYRPPQSLRASTSSDPNSPFDLKELFSIGNNQPSQSVAAAYPEYYPTNVWPEQCPAFQAALAEYYMAMRSLAGLLGNLFEPALGLPNGFFASRSRDQLSMLATIHYPALDEQPESEQLRFGAHRDRSCFTVLSTTAPGLQVQDSADQWHHVPFAPDAFIINVGRMLSNWTGGRWVAPMHRVGLPAGETLMKGDRQSVAFFYSPSPDVMLTPMFQPSAPADANASEDLTVADHMRSMLGLYR